MIVFIFKCKSCIIFAIIIHNTLFSFLIDKKKKKCYKTKFMNSLLYLPLKLVRTYYTYLYICLNQYTLSHRWRFLHYFNFLFSNKIYNLYVVTQWVINAIQEFIHPHKVMKQSINQIEIKSLQLHESNTWIVCGNHHIVC